MPTIVLNTDAIPSTRSHKAPVWLIVAVLATAFYFIEHRNDQVSNLEAFTISGEEMAAKAADGDAGRRMAFPAIALLGVILLARRDGWRLELRSTLGWMLLGYLTWCGSSILWSTDMPLTVRRFSVLLFCCIAALGIARQIRLRDLCLITLAVTTILIANSVLTELALGTFRPFASDYRFAGTLHPNVQAPYCATMALAAACLASRAKRGRLLLWSLCLAGVTCLVLTKSRTVCGAFLAGLLVFSLYGTAWPKKVLAGLAILSAGAAVAWAGLLLGGDIERHAVNVALIGRQEEKETESLSGRVPLWASVIPHLQEHALLGHGYQTFWNPARIETFTRSFQFLVPDGHSAYLDAALDLGIIGAGLCLVAVVVGVREAGRGYLKTRDLGYGFLLALLACRSLNGLLESNFAAPTSFVPFIMVCGLAHLGFCREPIDSSFPNSLQPIES